VKQAGIASFQEPTQRILVDWFSSSVAKNFSHWTWKSVHYDL